MVKLIIKLENTVKQKLLFIRSLVWRNIGSAAQLAGVFSREVLTLLAAVGTLVCEALL